MGNILYSIQSAIDPDIYISNKGHDDSDYEVLHDEDNSIKVSEIRRISPGLINDKRKTYNNGMGPMFARSRIISPNGDVEDATKRIYDFMKFSTEKYQQKILTEADLGLVSAANSRRVNNISGGPYFVENNTPNTILDVEETNSYQIVTPNMNRIYSYNYTRGPSDYNITHMVYDPMHDEYVHHKLQFGLDPYTDSIPFQSIEEETGDYLRARSASSRTMQLSLPSFDGLARYDYI